MANKRVPQKLKLVRGTYRKDRDLQDRGNSTAGLKDVPRAPKRLGKEAKALWRRLATYLVDANILHDHHLPTLGILCMEYQIYIDASTQLATRGDGLPLGPEDRRELRLTRAGAGQTYRLFLLEFGLTPAAVEKIPKPKARREMDNIEKMLTGG